jgi:hypothetical protein
MTLGRFRLLDLLSPKEFDPLKYRALPNVLTSWTQRGLVETLYYLSAGLDQPRLF